MGLLIDGCSGACAGTGIEPQAKRRKIRKEMDNSINLAAPRYWIPHDPLHQQLRLQKEWLKRPLQLYQNLAHLLPNFRSGTKPRRLARHAHAPKPMPTPQAASPTKGRVPGGSMTPYQLCLR